MSADPLVVIDADVLGRLRTGDESYVRNLLRCFGEIGETGLRLAAVTRHPELVPTGVEALPLETRVQELRMAWALPRLLRRRGAALVHTQYALPLRVSCPAVVTIHDPFVSEYQGELWACVRGCDAAVVMVAHGAYRALDLAALKAALRTPVLVDGRHVFDATRARAAGLVYRCVGVAAKLRA